MSKSLKKLIDINRLREFKNKLVGTGSAYVQTSAVDQTIAGTKTFSKPIVGSVTGSSGSCTGNAASATKATQDAAGNTITTTYATKAENNTKANNSEVVHKSGDETVNGSKTFTSEIVNTSVHAFRHIFGDYGVFWRHDNTNLYLMLTNSGDQYGGWNNFRPLVVNLATGICSINGNANSAGSAGSATNATYANWLRTSSHSDHLFHTEWDNAGYFWTYVTAGDGGYRAVRVARSDSSGNADTATKAANADHATKADSATKAASADRASIAGCVQTSDYHEIRFDWDSQVSGCVGLRVDATNMGGIATTSGTYGGMTVGSATRATRDSDGNQISTTYLKKTDMQNLNTGSCFIGFYSLVSHISNIGNGGRLAVGDTTSASNLYDTITTANSNTVVCSRNIALAGVWKLISVIKHDVFSRNDASVESTHQAGSAFAAGVVATQGLFVRVS